MGRILTSEVIDLSFVSYKLGEKYSPYDIHVRNKCEGTKEYHSSKFIHHLHKSHFVHDPFSHIVKLHFILQIIFHLIRLWVLSFTFRKRFFCSVDTVLTKCGGGGSLHYIIFYSAFVSNFLIFFSHFPLIFAIIHNFFYILIYL